MKTLILYLENSIECGMALADMCQRIPCFIEVGVVDGSPDRPVTIRCRESDAAFVENSVAPYV